MRGIHLTGAIFFLLILKSFVLPLAYADLPQPSAETEQAQLNTLSPSSPAVALLAGSGAAILFTTGNGQAVGGVPAQELTIPHLVLNRNGSATPPEERTLFITITGLQVPPPGVTVTLSIETQHGDPDAEAAEASRMPVWHETVWITNSSSGVLPAVAAEFVIVFDRNMHLQDRIVRTPTDYFRYEIVVTDPGRTLDDPIHRFNADYAFLMENQWVAALPEVLERVQNAAPDELVIHYCDMFPFQTSTNDPGTRLPREAVEDTIRTELLPSMLEAFHVQSHHWGFPWYPEWTGYRPEEGARTLSVAFVQNGTWFHGRSPVRGHAGISIRVDGGMVEYEALTDGIMSTFHHELFHHLQLNISQHYGGNRNIEGKEGIWDFISEGTAVLATSVAQTGVQFEKSWGLRAYLTFFKGFLGSEGFNGGDLNKSYADIDPYHTAAYWRFLYEQCGGMRGEVENPAAGMQLIRRILETLYAGEVVDIYSTTDLVGNLPRLMDSVLADSPACPFRSYSGSLVKFAQAIYRLKLEDGRCIAPGTPVGCGFYDPNRLYPYPPITTVALPALADTSTVTEILLAGDISGSYGMDFIDIGLDPTLDGSSLALEFEHIAAGAAEFEVQLWLLKHEGGSGLQRIPAQIGLGKNLDGRLVYILPEIDSDVFNRLGLIVVRLDSHEDEDPKGEYTIKLSSD